MRLIPYRSRFDLPTRHFPEISRFFDDFLSDFPLNRPSRRSDVWVPAVDIVEKGEDLVLRAELPGVNPKDISIKVDDNVLTLTGERKSDVQENGNHYHRSEMIYGSFSRTFTLPVTVDADKIKAEYKNGVLTVTLPHKSGAKPKEIAITVS